MSWRVSAQSYRFNWLRSLYGAADPRAGLTPPGAKPLAAAQLQLGLGSGVLGSHQLQAGPESSCPLPHQLPSHTEAGFAPTLQPEYPESGSVVRGIGEGRCAGRCAEHGSHCQTKLNTPEHPRRSSRRMNMQTPTGNEQRASTTALRRGNRMETRAGSAAGSTHCSGNLPLSALPAPAPQGCSVPAPGSAPAWGVGWSWEGTGLGPQHSGGRCQENITLCILRGLLRGG